MNDADENTTEIEVKFLEIDARALILKLKSLGARKTYEGPVQGFYYDFPDGKLEQEHKLVRFRTFGTTAEFTGKHEIPHTTFKKMREFPVFLQGAENIGNMRIILDALGLKPVASQEKDRMSYVGPTGIHYDFDTIKGIPTYLEVEAHTESDLVQAAEDLGLSMNDAKKWGSAQVIAYYKEREQ